MTLRPPSRASGTRSCAAPAVEDALATCEDPALGWSLQFWVTLADPLTQHVFFACPASGQCSWDPPVGAFVVPRSPDGEWWELADSTRNNRSYYYNTLTGKTQWTRPRGNAFVIPLGLIQRNALPARSPVHKPSLPNTRIHSPSTPSRERSYTTQPAATASKSQPKPTIPVPLYSPSVSVGSPSVTAVHTSDVGTPSRGLFAASVFNRLANSPLSPPSPSASPTKRKSMPTSLTAPNLSSLVNPLSVVEERTGSEADKSDNSGTSDGGWWDKRRTKALEKKDKKSKANMKKSISVERLGISHTQNELTQPSPTRQRETMLAASTSALPKDMPLEPIFVEQPASVETRRLSTGLHPLLPPDISTQIQAFQADDFSRKYFAIRRTGMFRTKVPVSRIMEWQRQPTTAPLLILSKQLSKDAVTCFKVIQHVMGERDRPVEGAKPSHAGSSALLAELSLKGKRKEDDIPKGFAGGGGTVDGGGSRGERMVVLEEIRWVIQVCVAQGEMRDEVYSQVIKQLTKNPDHDSVVLGFQLFCVFVNSFGPSKNFETFVKNFLEKHLNDQSDGIGVMAKYCMTKIETFSTIGRRAKPLTVGEIEHASDAAFYPSVYGESLVRIMDLQKTSYPQLKVPVILPFLADGILALGGTRSEGIFRVPGDGDSVAELKSRMDRGHYQLKGIGDPHVVASLFKLWLRELEEPLIPTALYNDALIASKDYRQVVEIVQKLPVYNRRVLVFVVSFVQMFIQETVVEKTKMGPMNLALVLAPNILRTTADSLVTVFTNSSFESKFMQQLLENMKPGEIDSDYVPVHGVAIG
ncbi:hypothetical protein CNBA6070 [Cryptococcus deneoformans B-3501A]|uniref:hypothetical protein n=1 Tax=Cryptococcus deneoformans (strain B-3501A) TaxID=283643 RepID=UPI000042E774|nr:hypothetical protein CNBA6070 [Cryptococcus neoformans var. neoformans B-3501A]EAL23082.1 hypothetical protein CNBA6070 [Cryptococcus neoformans var. neoformans B-3501A]